MQSSLVVWTPTESSSVVDIVDDDVSTTDNFVTRALRASDEPGALHCRCDYISGGLTRVTLQPEFRHRDIKMRQSCYSDVELKIIDG